MGAGALALWACGDNTDALPLASAIFEPTSDALLVSVWGRGKLAHVVVEADGQTVVSREVALDFGYGVVDVTGLMPATTYTVTVSSDDGARVVHRAATAPLDARPVRVAISADLDPVPEFENGLIAQIAASEPDVFLSIGDFPYTDDGPIAETVDQYRERHLALRSAPSVRPLWESCALACIYDDHEFRNDWDAHFVAMEGDRYAAAMQVWDEFFPLRNAVGDTRYRSFRWGANLEVFVLDCRRFRSADAAPDGPDKTMLGATQLAWFLSAIRASSAAFKLVLTSIPLDFGNGDDHWANFVHERDYLFAQLVGVTGLLFVSGDQHWFAAHRHAHGIREFQCGPLARGFGMPAVEAPGVLFRSVQYNALLLDVTPTTLTATGLGADGSHFYSETLSISDLTPT